MSNPVNCPEPNLSYDRGDLSITGDTSLDNITQEELQKLSEYLNQSDGDIDIPQTPIGDMFDSLVQKAKDFLQEEFQAHRITGNEFTLILKDIIVTAMSKSADMQIGLQRIAAEAKIKAQSARYENLVNYANATKLLEERTYVARQEHEAELNGKSQRKIQELEYKLTGAKIELSKKQYQLYCSQSSLYKRQIEGYDDQYTIDKLKHLINLYSVYAPTVPADASTVAIKAFEIADNNDETPFSNKIREIIDSVDISDLDV